MEVVNIFFYLVFKFKIRVKKKDIVIFYIKFKYLVLKNDVWLKFYWKKMGE